MKGLPVFVLIPLLFAGVAQARPSGASHPPVGTPPTISQVTPSTAIAGSGQLRIVVTGTNLSTWANVRWNGVVLRSTRITSHDLAAIIPASDIAAAGTANITLADVTFGGTTVSSAVTFTVLNPVPVITG